MLTNLDVKKTVKKSNVLNELRNSNASMGIYRLFCVYLAHLPMNSEDNKVTFTLADYAQVVGLDRPRKADLFAQAHNIVGTTAGFDNEDGGFDVYPLFMDFKLHKLDGEWAVSLECNPYIAPMIREQKGRFLRYKLYNTIYLKSYNQQRIYELLKQYERIGERTIPLADLRAFLSIKDDEYPVWGDFAQKVLKVAQKAIKQSTDICFEYEPIKKGRPVVAVRFIIKKNDGFIDQLNIDDFLPPSEVEYEGEAFEVENDELRSDIESEANFDRWLNNEEAAEEPDELALYREVLPPDLTDGQIKLLVAEAKKYTPFHCVGIEQDLAARDMLREKTLLMNAQTTPIASPFAWLRNAILMNYE